MKNKYRIILCMILVLTLTGCGNNNNEKSSESTANDTQSQDTDISSAAESPEETPIFSEIQLPTLEPVNEFETDMSSAKGSPEQVDVDLSVMSTTMIYSEVYNMMTNPKDYIGKTIKMNGTCATYHDEQTDKDYYACIVKDATACCSQGIEFELEQPDYPKPDEEITVIGTFQTYVEAGNMFCVLKNANLWTVSKNT